MHTLSTAGIISRRVRFHRCGSAPKIGEERNPIATRLSDEALQTRLKRRDERALAALYDYYGAAVFSMAYRVLNVRETAEEVTQDVFLYLWRNPEAWQPARGKLASWLLIVTRYRAVDRLRREQRLPVIPDLSVEDLSDVMGTADDGLQTEGQLLRHLMTRLPQEQSSLIDLAFFGGLTHQSVAEVTRLPLGTVKTRIRAGLQALHRLWLEERPEIQRRRHR
jgi:RNA polymerase sigma-70 factor (ECF subfamily)